MVIETPGSRSTASSVSFAHSFRLGADSRELPAGTYAIHTHEDRYESSFDPAYVVVEVELIVETLGRRSSRLVRPIDLEAAMARDAALVDLTTQLSENPYRGLSDGSDLPIVTAC